MTIAHHPTEEMLTAFAAGTLDLGQHVAIATHLVSCRQCRAFARSIEHVGGTIIENLPPATMAAGALADAEAQLNETVPAVAPDFAPDSPRVEVAGLPFFVRRYRFGNWKWIAPSVYLRPIVLPAPSETRVFLLKSGPGTRMLQHSHTDIELTCVLSGAFSHDGGCYGPGDFDLGDESIQHQPIVESGAECVCLVAMQGRLKLNGLFGRIVQPFVRL
jgi:putative transcriptional regulator